MRGRDHGSPLLGVPTFAFLNRSFTGRLPIALGGMLGSYPKEVATVLDEQLLTEVAL
jgi:hypothetical protein